MAQKEGELQKGGSGGGGWRSGTTSVYAMSLEEIQEDKKGRGEYGWDKGSWKSRKQEVWGQSPLLASSGPLLSRIHWLCSTPCLLQLLPSEVMPLAICEISKTVTPWDPCLAFYLQLPQQGKKLLDDLPLAENHPTLNLVGNILSPHSYRCDDWAFSSTPP